MKYNDNGTIKEVKVKAFDTLPVGAEVDYDGETVPSGWTEVADPNTYSTDEVRIGTWINGKPLYRKLIVSAVGTISSSGTIVNNEISTPTNSDISTLRIKEAHVLNADRLIPAIMYLNDTLNYFIKVYPLNTNKIRISTNNSSYSENTVYILVEYTKTTD